MFKALNVKIILLTIAVAASAFFIFYYKGDSCEITARNALPNSTFSQLPPMPQGFCFKLREMRERKITLNEFAALGEAYWLQPELQPTFEEYAIKAMLNPPENRWAATGYSAYPSDIVTEIKAGETIERVFFFKTSWLVESYQGIALNYEIEGQTKDFGVELTPREFLLGPSYPIFDRNWVEKINVKVKAGEVPAGEYLIKITPAVPSQSANWSQTYPHYFDATGFGLDKPFATIKLIVNG